MFEVDEIKFETLLPILEAGTLCVSNSERQVLFKNIGQIEYAHLARVDGLL